MKKKNPVLVWNSVDQRVKDYFTLTHTEFQKVNLREIFFSKIFANKLDPSLKNN